MRCNVYRGNFIESSHQVQSIVLDAEQNVLFQSGQANHITCIRSSFKPFQAYPFIYYKGHRKYQFTTSEIALLCASHNGELTHINTAKAMLQKLNLNPNQLQCGMHLPADKITRRAFIQNHTKLSPLYNNCSGKHIGMLGLTQLLNYKQTNYINKTHPVQKKIFTFLQKNHSIKPKHVGIDGCGAAAPFFTIYDIAKLYEILGITKDIISFKKLKENIKNAELSEFISIKEADFFKTEKERERHLQMVFNPPYGERIPVEMETFYKNIGDTLKQNYKDTEAWFITSNLESLKHVGLRTSRKIKLYNGSLESRLVKYDIYAGSKKAKYQNND